MKCSLVIKLLTVRLLKGMNSVSFNKYFSKILFFIFFYFWPLGSARKIMALPDSAGLQPPPSSSSP